MAKLVMRLRRMVSGLPGSIRPRSGGPNQGWVTGAAPCLVKRALSVQKRPATHGAGVITEISAHRDAEKQQAAERKSERDTAGITHEDLRRWKIPR